MKAINRNTLILITAISASALALTAQAESDGLDEAYDAPVSLDLTFIYHVDADMHEQDIFVEREPGSGEVYRVTKADQNMSAPLYRAATPIEHAPFEPEKVGPFPKGDALGITLGEWFAGEGQGTYTCPNGQGQHRRRVQAARAKLGLHDVALVRRHAADDALHRHLRSADRRTGWVAVSLPLRCRRPSPVSAGIQALPADDR